MSTAQRLVVHVIAPEAAGGGAESVIAAITSADPASSRVVALNQIAAQEDPPHPFVRRMESLGVRATEIRCGRRRYVNESRELAGLLREWGASLIHAHGYHGDVVAYLAARKMRMGIVSTVHGYIRRNRKERLFNAIDRSILRRFSAVIAVSAELRQELIAGGVSKDRIHLVENGIANNILLDRTVAREALGLPLNARVCGWVGRLSPEKGPDLFLKALREGSVDADALLIGDGIERERLLALASKLNLDRVHFAGFRSDAAALLPAFDVLALTSRTEGTPMVILEAVAAGVPVVAFAVGGIPALLSEGTCWLVAPEDVRSLGQAIAAALSSPGEAQRRAQRAGTELRDQLSADRWVERVRAVYTRVEGERYGTYP